MNRTFLHVKAVSDEGTGEFEAILSTPGLDRDGEIIDAGAFDPLPESIPIHINHDADARLVVARARPFYEGGVLKVRGRFSSKPLAQEIRQDVKDGIITTMSVGFMNPVRKLVDGVPHVVNGELLEGSFVSIPANRGAQVLAAKKYDPSNLAALIAEAESWFDN